MIEMFKIKPEEIKIKVPCNSCTHKGIVDKNCPKCGGKGVHNKTIKVYKVAKHAVNIVRIDRASKDSYYKEELLTSEGELRYWEDFSNYYSEHTKLLHFTKEDAREECDRRNKDIQHILDLYENNKVVDDNFDYKVGDKFIVPEYGIGTIVNIYGEDYRLKLDSDSECQMYANKEYLDDLERAAYDSNFVINLENCASPEEFLNKMYFSNKIFSSNTIGIIE